MIRRSGKRRHQRVAEVGITMILVFMVLATDGRRVCLANGEPESLRPPRAPIFLPEPTPIAELESRRARLAHAVDHGIALLEGTMQGEAPANSDRNFYYLTGIDEPEARLVMRMADGIATSTLFLPKEDPKNERWNGDRIAPGADALRASGIDDQRELGQYAAFVAELLAKSAHRPTVWLDRNASNRGSIAGQAEIGAIEAHVYRLRQVKSPYEERLLTAAIDTTYRGYDRALASVRPGRYEFQIEAEVEAEFMRRGSPVPGYPSIIGSGPNSCVLHYNTNRRRTRDGELVLFDVGAQCGPYTADISRTAPVNGKFTARQREVYDWVLEAQRAAIEGVEPGTTLRELNAIARRSLAKHGVEKHLLHGISHHVGLDVHDPSADRQLVPGMVITIEPGLYFVGEQLGVRIEDMVIVTDDGCRVMSAAIPKEADQIEAWMRWGSRL